MGNTLQYIVGTYKRHDKTVTMTWKKSKRKQMDVEYVEYKQ